MKKNKYRNELKYLCTAQQAEIIKYRLKNIIPLDRYVNDAGVYHVRSLYFDDIYDTALFENVNGVDDRSKFRIRHYGDDRVIHLELKKKLHGHTLKHSAPLTREQSEALIRGDVSGFDPRENPEIVNKLVLKIREHMMRPVTIVQFTRTPFVYKIGNVRVTIDANIASSVSFDKFFDKHIPHRPLMAEGQCILEVKYDELLPTFIKQCIEIDTAQYTAFSKYSGSRHYHL